MNKKYIITPITEEEIIEYNRNHEVKITMQNIIALYKHVGEERINVGFPAKSAYVPSLANMYGYKESVAKSLFLNGGLELFERAKSFDKPVYAIGVDDNQIVSDVTFLNMYDNSIDSVLDSNISKKMAM